MAAPDPLGFRTLGERARGGGWGEHFCHPKLRRDPTRHCGSRIERPLPEALRPGHPAALAPAETEVRARPEGGIASKAEACGADVDVKP